MPTATKVTYDRPQTFVLVHGGWCWRRVAEVLRAAGHVVFTPTLTGLGERADLLHPGLTIEDMATDVAVSVVADRMPKRRHQTHASKGSWNSAGRRCLVSDDALDARFAG